MSRIGQPERATQARVIALFRDELRYRYLGDWSERDGNSTRLSGWLVESGYSPAHVSRALDALQREANNHIRRPVVSGFRRLVA